MALANFIIEILTELYGADISNSVAKESTLLSYIDRKTASVSRSSKARGSFGNLYAIFVLVEDYVNNEVHTNPGRYGFFEVPTRHFGGCQNIRDYIICYYQIHLSKSVGFSNYEWPHRKTSTSVIQNREN